GTYRYGARHETKGTEMGMGGVYREIVAPERIVSTERVDEAWDSGEAAGTRVLVERGGKTTLTVTMRYESRAARDAVLKSGMETGVAASYDRLADLLASPLPPLPPLPPPPPPPPRRVGRSIRALVAGFVAVVVLSLGPDEIFHLVKVYPPWGERMTDGLFGLATAYRIVYSVAGGYIVARLAPYAPLGHAILLVLIGLVPGVGGGWVAFAKPELGPLWYPVALAVTGLPCAWLGGALYRQPIHP